MVLFSILFCVNSSVVLYAFSSKEVRSDDTSEIRHLVHCLLLKGYVQLFIGFFTLKMQMSVSQPSAWRQNVKHEIL